jgi:hypothetical protein
LKQERETGRERQRALLAELLVKESEISARFSFFSPSPPASITNSREKTLGKKAFSLLLSLFSLSSTFPLSLQLLHTTTEHGLRGVEAAAATAKRASRRRKQNGEKA